ncbi:MAG: zinc ribbon domain-containing protein [Atopobiaceae bacterium]|nr:zinc ribbon domain-containing protein [Atopobiaceae bacterium]
MYCDVCGTKLDDDSVFCTECGHRIEVQENRISTRRESGVKDRSNARERRDSVRHDDDYEVVQESDTYDASDSSTSSESFRDVAAGWKERVSGAAESLRDAIGPSSSTAAHESESESVDMSKRSNREDYLSDEDLWTWLKKDEKRQVFFTDQREQLTEDAYMRLVTQRLVENKVPATIERRFILWDNGASQAETYLVKTSSTAVNPLSCLLHFSNVGHFSFVEQKTFLAPPNLPPYPQPKKPLPDVSRIKLIGYGVACFIAGLLTFRLFGPTSIALMVVGLGMFAIGLPVIKERREVTEFNAKCDQQRAAYNRAWKDWEDTVFIHSFQESTNGKISRIYQAVFESIKQVNAEQFKDIESTVEQTDTSMAELRQQISSLKESYR